MRRSRYRTLADSVYHLQYHFVWCTKYRKAVLVGSVAEMLTRLLGETAQQLDVQIETLNLMPDAVHVCVLAPPTEAPQHLVNQFKGSSSHMLREQFPHLRSQLPSLWSRSYYVSSAGTVTMEMIASFIATQKTRR